MGRTLCGRGIWAALAVVLGGCGPDALEPGAVVIENVNVITMTGPDVLRDATVVVQGDSVLSISVRRAARPQNDTEVIDGRGGYVLPGLIDPHVHVRREAELALFVAAGVTSVRNMNGNFGDPLAWRARIEAGSLLGPRLVTASPTLFDESPDYRWHVAGPKEAREMTRQFEADGYDLIKVYRLSEPTFMALSDEARELGIPVAGHYPAPTSDLGTILSSGILSIEHVDELVGPAFDGRSQYDRIPEVVREIRASGVAIGTILSQWQAYNRGLDEPEALLTDSLLATARRYFGDAGEDELRRVAEDIRSRDADSLDRDRSDFPFLFALVSALDSAGVPIVASTDAHQALAPAGEALVNELSVLSRAGLSNYAVLRAATVTAASVLGLSGRAGVVSPGAAADLVLLAADPLKDLEALRSPTGVMLRGEWLEGTRLDALRDSALSVPR